MRLTSAGPRKHYLQKKYIEGLDLFGAKWEADYRVMITCPQKAGITGLKLGDPEGVVGEAIGDNWDGVLCIQAHLFQLFVGQDGG